MRTGYGSRNISPALLVRRLLLRVALWGALALFLIAGGCLGGSAQGVKVAQVTRGDLIKTVSAAGVLQASQPTDVIPQVSATIVGLPVKDGDYVNAGDTLAVLDPQELAQQEAQAKANYYTSQAIGDILQGSYASMQSLYASLQYAGQVFSQMQSQIDTLVLNLYDIVPALMTFLPPDQQAYLQALIADQRAGYLQAMSSRVQPPSISSPGYPSSAAAAGSASDQAASINYNKIRQATSDPNIKAPVSGYVVFVTQQPGVSSDVLSSLLGGLGSLTSGSFNITSLLGLSGIANGQSTEIKVGAQLTAGQPAFQIVDLQNMSVKAQVDETDIPNVSKGQKAQVSLDAYPGTTFTGTVDQVAVKSESGSGGTTVFPVIVNIDRTGIPLRLGYNSTVDIQVLDDKDVITIPLTALMESGGGDYVFVIEDGKAHQRRITVGPRSQDAVEVTSGLDVGESIVSEGVDKVKEGQKVQ